MHKAIVDRATAKQLLEEIAAWQKERNIRNLTIRDENGRLHVLCSSAEIE